jgi:NAD(P)-dependent dehydrogenase (short-subunit alcohol dehydrogenase family)
VPLTSLKSRHIVVTGASRGIGRALAYELATRGAHLTLCARSEETLSPVIADTDAVGHVLDICDVDAVAAWITDAIAENGPVDALINNASLLGPKTVIAEYPMSTWNEVMAVNVNGTLVVTQAVLPHLVRPGGVLLHMSSYLGRHGLERYGAYCASKFAVEGLSQMLAEEHRDEGLISCTVGPGMVQTEMLKGALETDDISEHTTAEEAAIALANLLETLSDEDSGAQLDLFPLEEIAS